jgi:hypothetical protein
MEFKGRKEFKGLLEQPAHKVWPAQQVQLGLPAQLVP